MGFLFDLFEAKRKREERKKLAEDVGKIAVGTILGAATGILFAPQSGEETRKQIADKAVEVKEGAVNTAKDVADSVQYKAYQVKDQASKTYEGLKEIAKNSKEKIEAEKEKAEEKAENVGEEIKKGAKEVKKRLRRR